MADWNPEQYLKFEKERTQPVKDLVARIDTQNPKTILDIGCGPGNSTKELKRRWPDAQITGLDYSPAMVEKANKSYPDINFIQGDATADLSYLGKFDLVFSNAAIQWMDNHESLIKSFFSLINNGGALAIQIPKFNDMPVSKVFDAVAASPDYEKYFRTFENPILHYSDSLYYDVLSALGADFYLWQTEYYHVLSDHAAIIDWCKSTSLTPYLNMLPNDEIKARFVAAIEANLVNTYPMESDGRVFFKFKRFFLIAYKS